MLTNEDKIKKLKTFAQNPDLAKHQEIQSIAESLDEIKKELPVKLLGVDVLTIKGEKGDKGDKGDQGDQGEKGDKGDKGEDSTVPGPKGDKGDPGRNGLDGLDGMNGTDGKDGRDGIDGKDGSPDTPQEIVSKLESLEGEDRLKASAIAGLKEIEATLHAKIDSRPMVGGVSLLTKVGGNEIGKGSVLNLIAGSNTTITGSNTDGHQTDITITSTGSAGATAFTSLTDVPNSYTSQAGKAVRVKATEDGLEFFSASGTGTVTSVSSADANATVATGTTTPVITIVSAPKLQTPRTIAGTSFDGSANISLANKFIVQGTTDSGLSGAQFLGALGTGILKNTTTTGVLSIAVAADFPTLNQNTTGSAASITGNLTGDVTSVGMATTIGAGKVTNAMLAGSIAASKLVGTDIATVGTITSGTWNGTAIGDTYISSAATWNAKLSNITGLVTAGANVTITGSGTSGSPYVIAASASSGMTNPMTTLGDVIYGGASGTPTRLAGNTTSAKQFLVQTGTGTVSAAPSWAAISAGDIPTLNQSTTGNAATATALQTPRAINGVNFDGTAAITVTAAAGTLTGTTLNSTVVSSSLTSVGTLASLSVTGNITNAALTASKVVFTDASKNLTSTGIGTSGQFIKGDGSLDSSTYLQNITSLISAGANITITGSGTGASPYVIAASASSGMTDPMTTAGDMIIRNGSNVTSRLASPAAAGYFLSTVGALGIPTWVNTIATSKLSGAVAIANGGTGLTDGSLNMPLTWNNVATTFTGWLLNVTDTASASGSLLLDLQKGGSSQFKVDKTGNVTVGGQTINAQNQIQFNGAWTQFQAATTNVDLDFKTVTGTGRIVFTPNAIDIARIGGDTTGRLELLPFGTSAGNTSELRFLELAANGTTYQGFKGPDSAASSTIYVLPSTQPTAGQYLQATAPTAGVSTLSWATPGGSGTVTSVSVVSANGFAGSVATSTTTPAITISTSITGLLKGNGTAISAATAGTDYLTPSGNGSALTGLTASQVGLGTTATPQFARLGLGQAADSSAAMAATGQYFSAKFALTDGATIALDWNNGNFQTVTLAGNRTFTFANPKAGARYVIVVAQDATGSRTVTWPTIKWAGGTAPTLTTTANKKDIITLLYDGTDYLGLSSANF